MVVVTGRGAASGGSKVNNNKAATSTNAKLKSKEKDKVPTTAAKGSKTKEKEVVKKVKRKDSDNIIVDKLPGKSKKEDASSLPTKVKAVKSKASLELSNAQNKEKQKPPPTKNRSSPSIGLTKVGCNNNSSSISSNNKPISVVPNQQPVANNKCIRTDNSMVTLSTNGPRIQAQRKFAQAGNIYPGTMLFNQNIPSNSPYATPSKETPFKRSQEGTNCSSSSSAKKVKKPMFSPPPCKRPKTEDFLTFLCVRGTSALPPEFDFFKFPQVLESEAHVPPRRKIFPQTFCTQSSRTVELQTDINVKSDNQLSQLSNKINKSNIVLKLKAQSKLQQARKIVKNTAKNSDLVTNNSDTTTKKSSSSSSAPVPVCKAENPTKGIRATASSVLFSKLRRTSPVTRARPILSPPRSRLNEQDARFAMTALKLKYQRLAVSKSNRSAILTKKAKESIILTRSRSQGKLSPKKRKLLPRTHKPVIISPSRNAPSPDIIFGVTCSSAARKRAVKSSSEESESEEEEQVSKNNKSSEEEEEEEEEENNDDEGSANDDDSESSGMEKKKSSTPPLLLTRSLRNGKELTRPKSKSPRPEKKQQPSNKMGSNKSSGRVGTRSAHRLTKSPLREIPMYKPKRLKRKLFKPNSKAEKKGTNNKNKMKDEKDKKQIKDGKEKKDIKKMPSPKKIVTDDGKRPSRKTKETATNLLGLLTHGFSTDDEDSEIDRKRDNKNEDSEVGSSSSSEAHYLEKHYTAALRREEEKFSRNKNPKSGMQRRSSRRDSTNESTKFENKRDNKTPERKLRSTRSTSEDVKSESRHLNKKVLSENKNKKEAPSTTTRTRRHGTPTVGDRKMPGAARKSASITCRGRSQYSSSENEEDSSSDHQSESEVGNNSADNEENKKDVKHTSLANKSRRKETVKDKLRRKITKSSTSSKSVRGFKSRKSDYSDDEDEQSEENANSNEEEENQEEGKESENEVENSEDEDAEEVKAKSKVKKKKRSSPNLSDARRRQQSSTQVKLKKEIKRERSSSMSLPRSEKSSTPFEREESVETEQCKLSPRSRLSRSRSRSGSYDKSDSNLVEESSSDDEEEEVEENIVEREISSSSEDEEEDEESAPEKVDVSTQVDMDEEEGIARPLVSLAELAGLVPPQKPLPPPGSKTPNNDSDDDVQEIGVVFASSSTSTSSMPARHSSSRSPEKQSSNNSAPSLSASGHSARTHGTPPCTSSSSPFLHHQHPTSPLLAPPLHQQPPQYHHHHHTTTTPPIIDPLLNNPFNPFMPPPPRSANIQQDFYTPLHLGPPLVQSFQLVGGTLGGIGGHFPVTSPLNTLSIPVTVPFSTHHLLPHHPSTMGFASGSTFHATTMQTHIRSVATNLDMGSNIPLVRPMVGSDHHSSSINFMSRGPSLGLSSNIPLTRPPVIGLGGVWGHHHHQPQIDPNAASRNHYSAFRVPHLSSTTATHTTHTTQHVIHHQSTTVLGMNSTPVLPVSIIQPQTHQQQNQTNVQSQPGGSTSHYQQQYHQNTPNKSKAEKQNTSSNFASSTSTSASTSSSSSTSTSMPSQRPKSPTPPGYHLIKHLPNVSIVPKFDRDSHNAAASSSLSYKKQTKNGSKNEKDEPREKKKVGRKKKESAVLPHPSSPLTVRKDSNPSTYAPKKQNKPGGMDKDPSSSCKEGKTLKSQSSSSSQHQSPPVSATKCPPKQKMGKDEGGRLVKKKDTSRNCLSPVPSSSSTTALITSSNNPKRGKSESPKTNKTNKKHEKDLESSCSSSKSHHNSNPPSRTSSPNVQSKCKSSNKFTNDRVAKPQIGITEAFTEAPTFHPTDQEFEDPLKYIQKIQAEAEKYGMARIVPPKSFRPECNVEDDMRFTAYNHYIHKMYQRWGPNVLECEAIKHNLKQNQVDVSEIPVIGGMEINLSTMYQTVKSFGSLNEVIEKQRWTKVADTMHVPKAAHDRAAKLELIYLKYVLPYAILSDVEREKLKKRVEKKWTKRRETILKAAESCEDEDLDEDSMDELDECIVKGKTTPLSAYYRVARNTLNLFFPTEKEHSFDEIEEEYWKVVRDRNRPVCVYSGSIDCAGVGWGFPIPKASNKHPWNLKVLANNQGSVLRSMGPVMGATVPTLHVAMLFTSYCWYRDPHSLPWIEFLHSGANKIWYSVAAENENLFRSALTDLMPMQCKKKQIWLASDSAMVPPEMLVAKGVPLVRMVQNPGEFLVVFPKAFTSAICTGYLISESVCFAYTSWLQTCIQTFKDIHDSKEPPVFPLEKLLLSILQDARASLEVVRSILPDTRQLIREEIVLRKKISTLGVKFGGKISTDSESDSGNKNSSKKKKAAQEEEIEQCYNCNYTLYLSMVRNLKSDVAMCLKHAVEHFTKHKADIKKCNLLYDLEESQLNMILENASKRCGNVVSLKS